MAVGVHVLPTFDFIDDLHTQLFHNHSSLVMFERREKWKKVNIAGINAAGGYLLLRKE